MINRYYHFICDEVEKEIYATLLEGLIDYQKTIFFSNQLVISPNLVSKVFKMVLYDNPKIFYTSTQGYVIGHNGATLFLKPKYFFSLQASIELQDWLEEKVAEICKPIVGINDDFAKEIFVHNYLIENVRYSSSAVAQPINAYTVAGTLLENNSVCAGVALSFKLLMDYLDIPCIAATGTATNNAGHTERHAWNIVYIENAFYQIDVTWDLLNEYNDRLIKYDYFNLTTQDMYQSRIPDYEYPVCNSNQHNYFYYIDAQVQSPSELITFVSRKIMLGEKRIYFEYEFDIKTMKNNITHYLRRVPGIGRYQYWINEIAHTVFIMRQ